MTPEIKGPEMPKPLPPILQPTGSQPKKKSATPSFLGDETRPEANQLGQKTLLGQ